MVPFSYYCNLQLKSYKFDISNLATLLSLLLIPCWDVFVGNSAVFAKESEIS